MEKLIKELPNGGRIEYYSKRELLTRRESVYGIINYRDLYNENGKLIYRVTNGWWVKYTYDDNNRMVYYENSKGIYRKVNFIYDKEKGCIKEEMEIL